jgi:type VI secretion system protein ImpM
MEAPGLFGKLTSHGDFVTRRLPPSFIAMWDAWLQASLQASRAALGARWLDFYLVAPVWRFALAPGVSGQHAWGGVLMPSVDRVGRHFPLTLAAACAGPLPLAEWLGGQWHARMEDLALSTLDARFRFDLLEEALRQAPDLPALPTAGERGADGWRLELAGPGEEAAAAGQVAAAALFGQSVWWTAGDDQVAPCVRLFRGLPPPEAFTAMLGG